MINEPWKLRRFYAPAENFKTGQITLDQEQSRHLLQVLRMNEGAEVRVFDGCGREFLCRIGKVEKRRTVLEIIREISPAAAESDLDLTLAVAVLKGEKFDLIVQKSVELGVTRLWPLLTRRCDVKLRDSSRKIERWQKIAVEASKQSGRARLLEIKEPAELDFFLKNSASADLKGGRVFFAERGGEGFTRIPAQKEMIAVIGPEGGWEEEEIETARDNGFQVITLGGRILRAETAAISIAALVQHNFGDLN
ncbi:MAG: 16S rRNA (uracil(1498)-N(3))-methyltransferase [Pyrinomonadaceae bacterium]